MTANYENYLSEAVMMCICRLALESNSLSLLLGSDRRFCATVFPSVKLDNNIYQIVFVNTKWAIIYVIIYVKCLELYVLHSSEQVPSEY